MTKNTVNDVERMVVTRVFDAPRELIWKAWTDPKYVMQWWGPKGFTAPVCEMSPAQILERGSGSSMRE